LPYLQTPALQIAGVVISGYAERLFYIYFCAPLRPLTDVQIQQSAPAKKRPAAI
jgi:hypothetical protein